MPTLSARTPWQRAQTPMPSARVPWRRAKVPWPLGTALSRRVHRPWPSGRGPRSSGIIPGPSGIPIRSMGLAPMPSAMTTPSAPSTARRRSPFPIRAIIRSSSEATSRRRPITPSSSAMAVPTAGIIPYQSDRVHRRGAWCMSATGSPRRMPLPSARRQRSVAPTAPS